jgi:hypothetical protein
MNGLTTERNIAGSVTFDTSFNMIPKVIAGQCNLEADGFLVLDIDLRLSEISKTGF